MVDATHLEADAALSSLRAELRAAPEPGGHEGQAEEPAAPERPALVLAPARSGPTPRRRAGNATARSRTDPDAALRHKPGQRPHLVHRAQVATDPKARVIVAVRAERATGPESAALPDLIERARWAGHRVAELVADSGYAGQAAYQDLEGRGVIALIPPQPNMLGHPEGRAARARGTPKLQVQLLLGAVAINLKRLISHADAAQGRAAGHRQAPAPSAWVYELCLN